MKTLLSTLLITLTLFSCAQEEKKDPSKLIDQIQKIEKEEMNPNGIELVYIKDHSVDLSPESRGSYMQWMLNLEAIQSIVNYIDVSNKLVDQFSDLQEDNDEVAEIILKNRFLKQQEQAFRDQLTLLNMKQEKEDNDIAYKRLRNSYRACPTNFIKDTSHIEALIDSIRDQDAISSEFKSKRLQSLNSSCEDFYEEYGIEKFSCVHRKNNGEVNVDASFLGWRLCSESEKIIIEERIKEDKVQENNRLDRFLRARKKIKVQKLDVKEIKKLEFTREKIEIN